MHKKVMKYWANRIHYIFCLSTVVSLSSLYRIELVPLQSELHHGEANRHLTYKMIGRYPKEEGGGGSYK